MKMLFFSSNVAEVEVVKGAFMDAGIACELRPGPKPRRMSHPPEAELWIRNDRDCHRALMLCVQLGLGFSRRPHREDLMETEQEPSHKDIAEAAQAA